MTKVLFVIGLSKNGGAEKRAKTINSLIKDEVDSKVFAFVAKPGEVDFAFKESYQEYKNESVKARINYLAEIIRQEKPNVVFSFLPHINFFTTKAVKKAKVKGVRHVVCIAFYQFDFLHKFLIDYSIKRSDSVYYQCDEQRQFVKCGKNYFVLPNPIIVPEYKERKSFNRFISVGRLEEQKGFLLQIEAFSEIAKRNSEATLDIFGNGSQKEMLNNRIKELGLIDRVKIHEYTDNINEEYQNHDVFLFTTKAEGFPNTLTEAMANSLVCFTTHFQTGCDELMLNNKTGFVCYNRDPQEFASLVCTKLSDVENAKAVAKVGHEHVKELCSCDKFKKRFIEEINKLV